MVQPDPSPEPELPDLNSPEQRLRLESWFNDEIPDVTFAAHAFSLVDRHFAAAGLVANLPKASMRCFVTRWSEFCWHLFHALYPLLDPTQEKAGQDQLITTVFDALIDYCLSPSAGGDLGWRLAMMLQTFAERDTLTDRLKALLPARMQAEMPAIRRVQAQWTEDALAREDELFRMGQMGY